MSKVKSALVMILKQQLQQMHPKIMQMDEDSLVKQVAKNKVLYNLTNKQNRIQLVYSFIALAEYYIANQLYEPAVKTLTESQFIQQTSDACYLLGICLFNLGKKGQAYHMFDTSLKQQWIEPSIAHQQANQLQSISYMQKIQFARAQKQKQKKSQFQHKLIALSYEKIKVIKKFDSLKKQNLEDSYYYALAMGDMAEIYLKFQDYSQAYEKIKTALQMLKDSSKTEKMIQFYYISANIADKLRQRSNCLTDLKHAIDLIQENKKIKQNQKFSKLYEDIYYLYIKNTLNA